MTVRDIAQTDIRTARRDASAADVAAIMRDENVGSVVVEEDDRPVGIVTDRDLAVDVLGEGADPQETTVEEVMTEDPVTVQTDSDVLDVTRTMAEHSVRRIPIVSEDDTLEGIVTLDDLLVLLTDRLDDLAGVIEDELPR